MVFPFGKRRRRRRLLREPVPGHWPEILEAAIPWFAGWDEPMRKKALNDTRIFVAEKDWEGCGGLELVEEMQIVIAAQAAMMLTGITDYCFDGVRTVLVYPGSFWRKTSDGLIVSDDVLAGEAWHRGPIVLSWEDVAETWAGHNVVVHELTHHLDGIDGEISGHPIFGGRAAQRRWEQVLATGYERLVEEVNAGNETLLDPYAATNRAEFLAVACETFFELPRDLRAEHPDLYECLAGLFNADPASWTEPTWTS
jgi:Mlc titration factor MtfA (ptsG expression regulator)